MKKFIIPDLTKPTRTDLSEYLKQSLMSFSNISGIPITFFDADYQMCWECNQSKKFCQFFDIYNDPDSPCRKNIKSALTFSSKLGEPYVFICKLGLIKVAVALIVDGEYLGSVVAGPLTIGVLRDSTLKTLLSMNELDDTTLSKVIIFLKETRQYDARQISDFIILLNNCVLASVEPNQNYSKMNKSYSEELKIGVDLVNNKTNNRNINYPYELEEELTNLIMKGEDQKARQCITELLYKISVLEFGNLHAIKSRLFEILAVLSRSITKGISRDDSSANTFFDELDLLNETEDYDELKTQAMNIVAKMADTTMTSLYSGSSTLIADAIKFMNENYANKISLTDIAEKLHTNSSYLSMLFKKEVGVTFTDYLNTIRINRAKQLLSTTNLSIVDISNLSGFEEQSYFTRVFKGKTQMTPKKYRSTSEVSTQPI